MNCYLGRAQYVKKFSKHIKNYDPKSEHRLSVGIKNEKKEVRRRDISDSELGTVGRIPISWYRYLKTFSIHVSKQPFTAPQTKESTRKL
jgi:hypothetical protein